MIRRILAAPAPVLGLVLAVTAVRAETGELTAAISLDIPPYVMADASAGLQVDIVRAALAGYDVRFLPMPYQDIDRAVQDGRADAAVSVQETDDTVFYSDDYITFANVAISKKADDLSIDRVADLAGHPVLTWQGAYAELGATFEELFAPNAPQSANYVEFADQEEQVRAFWQRDGAVAVIDRSIFRHLSEAMDRSMTDVSVHSIFPPVTDFKVGFRDAADRDAFNHGLNELCRRGDYAVLLDQYGVVLEETVCDTK